MYEVAVSTGCPSIAPLPHDDLGPGGQPEPAGDVGRRPLLADHDPIDRRRRARRLDLDDKRRLASIPMATSEPVGPKPAHLRPGPHVVPPTVLRHDQTFGLQDPERLLSCRASHAVVVSELRFGRELVALDELPRADHVAQVIGDLPEHRSVTGRVDDLREHVSPGARHQNSSTRLHMGTFESTDP
jgi:hypothetical protein